MNQADSVSVLQDAYFIAMLAALLAVVVYGALRRTGSLPWHTSGNVHASSYRRFDLAAVLLLLSLLGARFWSGLWSIIAGAASAVDDGGGAGAGEVERQLSVDSLLAGILTMLMMGAFVIVYLRVFRDLNPSELFGLRQMSMGRALAHAAGWVFCTYLVILLVASFKGDAVPDKSPQETVRAYKESTGGTFRALMAFMAVVVAPLTEEPIFRGFAYGVVKRFTDRWFALIFSAALFSVIHVHLGSALELFVLGAGFALAYEKTGCLLVPVFMHMLFNGWNVFWMTFGDVLHR